MDNSHDNKYKSIRMYFDRPSIKRNKTFIQFNDSNIRCYNVSVKHFKKLGLQHLLDNKKQFNWSYVPPNVMEL
jgi:hypothetical protein